jgi:hypothetical protein
LRLHHVVDWLLGSRYVRLNKLSKNKEWMNASMRKSDEKTKRI